jgi:hypothetical protein
MDWTQQMEQLSKQWLDAQRAFWASWTGETSPNATPSNTALWLQMIEAWRTSLNQMLDIHAEGVRLWADQIATSDAAPAVQQGADQLQAMTKQWIASQKQLWEGWFLLLERLDPATLNHSSTYDPHSITKLWQEMAQQTMSAQQQWAKLWSNWQPGKKG